MSHIDVSIIVVSYNTRKLTLECLKSVYAETKGIDFELIVIDNASTDGSAAAIREDYEGCRLIDLDENVGFARANNIACEHARGKYVLLLNPDTVVLDGAIQKLFGFAETNQDAGIYGGPSFSGQGVLDRISCRRFPGPWSLFCRAVGLAAVFKNFDLFNRDEYRLADFSREIKADIISGCFFMVTGDLWRELKGFDPVFFMFGEEVDLCMRARKRGRYCLYTPNARIIHYGGASERAVDKMMLKLLSAKSTIIRREWPRFSSWFGLSMLWLWIFRRMCLARCFSFFLPRKGKESSRTWGNVWNRRKTWLRGY